MAGDETLLKVFSKSSFSSTQLDFSLSYNRQPSSAEELASVAGYHAGFVSGFNTAKKELEALSEEVSRKSRTAQDLLSRLEGLVDRRPEGASGVSYIKKYYSIEILRPVNLYQLLLLNVNNSIPTVVKSGNSTKLIWIQVIE
jgi:hypothetical protein